MIERMGFHPARVYFINYDLTIKDLVLGHGVYRMPIGGKGAAMVNARDIDRSRPSS